MKLWEILSSEKAAWVIGAVVVGVLALLAYRAIGWLGIGILGIGGLIVTNRAELFSTAVPIYARHLDAKPSPLSPEQKMAVEAERQKKTKVLYLVNTFFIGLLVLGLAMFVRFQFPH